MPENLADLVRVGEVELEADVEPSRADEGVVETIYEVGRSEDDAAQRWETVWEVSNRAGSVPGEATDRPLMLPTPSSALRRPDMVSDACTGPNRPPRR